MRTPESRIKECILYPEEEVRLTALACFSRSHTSDETVMPLVIRAVEQYGRERGFGLLRSAEALPQTEETIAWLAGELTRDWDLESVDNDNYCFAVALALCQARTDLLRPDMITLPCFPEELYPWLAERCEMASWDWQAGWAALEELGRDAQEWGGFRLWEDHRARRIIDSLARHPDKPDVILNLLRRRYRGHDRRLMEWLGCYIAELAGLMRLEEAVPILVDRLHEDDIDFSAACMSALIRIGNDTVVNALTAEWPGGGEEFRTSAAEVLEQIHTDLSAKRSLQFLANQPDGDAKSCLARTVLGQFIPEAIEPVRQMVLGDDPDVEELDLRYQLLQTCTVMEQFFPEYGRWYDQAVQNNWGRVDYERWRMRHNFRQDEDESGDEDWKAYEPDDFDDLAGEVFDETPPALRPILREQPRVGRNDPCPCGSGKKYKKCCGKQ